MKCLMKYQWVKLPRDQMPPSKGIMGAWARLAARAAFRNGQAHYCGYVNQVTMVPGLAELLASRASWVSRTEKRPWR